MSGRGVMKRRAADCARMMPELRHSTPGEPFDIRDSEVARWLCERPEIQQYVFDAVKASGVIVYDGASKTWRGVER